MGQRAILLPEAMASDIAPILAAVNIGCAVEIDGERTHFGCSRDNAIVELKGRILPVNGGPEKVFVITPRQIRGRGLLQGRRDLKLWTDIEHALNKACDQKELQDSFWKKKQ